MFGARNAFVTKGPSGPQWQLWAWGKGSYGPLGLGNTTSYSSPKQVGSLTNWSRGYSGGGSYKYFSIVTTQIGALLAWGANTKGQLGLGNTTDYSSPKQVGALTTWSKVAVGNFHTVSIKTDGTLWSWGFNAEGQLGVGDTTDRSSPTQVGALTTWASISAGKAFCLAIKTNGTLWSWGRGYQYCTGQGNTTDRSSPTQVGALTTWSKISAGMKTGLAIKTNGTLWSWGGNQNYQAAIVPRGYQISSPTQVGALTNWSTISSAGYNGNATKTDGTLWAWGYNRFGTVGDGTTDTRSNPVQIGALTNWSSTKIGWGGGLGSAMAIKTNGTLFSWGVGTAGALGLGNTTDYSSPKQVGVLTTWVSISIGTMGQHTLATKTP